VSDNLIYVVDDEEPLAKGLALTLRDRFRTELFFTAKDALAAVEQEPCDLMMLDVGLPDMSGLEVLKQVKARFPDIAVIMITGFDQVEMVVSAMKAGAYDYLVKPVRPEGLEVTLENALESIRLRKEIKLLQEKLLQENLPVFIGESQKTQNIMRFVEKVAASPDTPILIIGESGTGKELIAGSIHYRSPNFRGPMISINCAAIPNELIESELFGYEKGAFSGADLKGKKGIIEQADNGTLFLDEIGDLSLKAQAKLLRFLETGSFFRVGGTKEIQVRVRIVSATNKDLEAMIADERFREDLWYRISVVKIAVPALYERPEDIPLIARYFLHDYAVKFGKRITGFSPEAESALMSRKWRGNVREVKNVIERAVLISSGELLTPEDLNIQADAGVAPVGLPGERKEPEIPASGIDLTSILDAYEKRYIQAALKMADGNETRAAELLQIKYSTFRYRRRKLNVD
jgi:DNA-binding NtrC family response regulator